MSATLKKNLTDEQKAFIDVLSKTYGPVVSRKQILEQATVSAIDIPWWLLREGKKFRAARGRYSLENILLADAALVVVPEVNTENVETASVSA